MIISFFCAVVLDISAMLIILVCLGIGIIDLCYELVKKEKSVGGDDVK